MASLGSDPPRPATQRYYFLDGLRGVAALAIVTHHFTANSGHREIFASASLAVDFFFCLSGFVIAHAYHERLAGGMAFAEYVHRRVKRLYPLYFVGLLLGLVALVVTRAAGMTELGWGDIALAYVLNAAYVPYLNHDVVQVYAHDVVGAIFPLNNPAWSLFFGMIANMVYALTVRHSRISPAVWMFVAAVGLVFAGYAFGTAPGWGTDNILGGLPRVLFAFFAGVVVFQMLPRLPVLPALPWGLVLTIVVLSVAIPRFEGFHYYWLVGALLGVPLLLVLGARVPIETGSALQAVCSYSGRISYAIFCVHYPVLMLFSVLVPIDPNYPVVALAYLATTLGTAHFALERFDRRLPRFLTSPRYSR